MTRIGAEMTTAPDIRDARGDERRALAEMLARAFADDPAMSYIFPDAADRAKRLPRLFAILFDEDGPHGLRLTPDDAVAATFWRGPGHATTRLIDIVRHLVPFVQALGGAVPRALTVSNAIEAHFPPGDFWYLHIAGCDPDAQGRGLGAAVVRAGLERIAGSGVPAYLETATERNLGFYGKLGFTVTGEWQVPRGGPRFWSMQRR